MWNLSFISEDDFTKHVKATIEKYGEKRKRIVSLKDSFHGRSREADF